MIRLGWCNQCGKCCEFPAPERIEAYRKEGYECKTQHLSGCPSGARTKDGRIYCTDYDNRPLMCRNFPQHPIDIKTLPECGYSFEEGL